MSEAPGGRPASDSGTGPLVRPYAVTGGRTRARAEIALEALLSAEAAAEAPRAVRGGETDTIIDLCRDVRSLAEVSAHLGLPVGVTRVLIGDLAADGVLTVHEPAATGGLLLERVLSGLHDL
jgi:Protein of unknown function (DUF742)